MTNTERHWWLYVLRLEDGKFYVGITSKTPEIRMQEHIAGVRAAYWTAKHKPIEILHKEDLGYIDESRAKNHENKMTRALMKQRGINNVRGGDLTSTEDYILRFGWIYIKSDWQIFTTATASLFINAFLLFYIFFLD